MRKFLVGMLALGAGVLIAVALLLPPRAVVLRQPEWRPAGTPWRGVFHVHTNRSDGTGTIEEVAAAAARAGVQFVVLADHGDGTRPPEPPRYLSGVLVIDGVEIATTGGHYVAVGLPRAPYPLGGEARDVAADVARLGGLGVIAHPDSPKRGLAWQDWEVPVQALEWLNADSQWRDEGRLRLARALLTYPFRPHETLASLLDEGAVLQQWDQVSAGRRIPAIAGADAHARIGFGGGGDPYEGRAILAWPSYEASFRTFSVHAVTAAPRTGRADEDARQVVSALRRGRVHTVVDAWASPAVFEFSARSGGVEAVEGSEVVIDDPVVIRVRSNAPLYAAVVLRRNGSEVHRVDRQSLVYATDRPGRYRAEVLLGQDDGRPSVPWIVSNAILVRGPGEVPAANGAQGLGAFPEGAQGSSLPLEWRVEHDPRSHAEIHRGDEAGGVVHRYRLGAGRKAGQFAALSTPVRLAAADQGISFTAGADRPMRVSVQLRAPGGRDGERWQRSVYLDQSPRRIVVPFAEMTPAGTASTPRPAASSVNALLFVVDTVNTAPGSSGSFQVSDLRLLAF